MRAPLWAVVAALLLAGSASAQQQASSFFTGVPAGQLQFTPIDTSKAVIQQPGQSALTSNRFNFSALFNKLTVPTYPPTTGVSPLPPASAFPSTHYQNFKMVGEPPYLIKWMFGKDKTPIQPQKPFKPFPKAPVGPSG
jgi:hypothetical protein